MTGQMSGHYKMSVRNLAEIMAEICPPTHAIVSTGGDMMNDFITIKIPLSESAWQVLRDVAQRDRRVPADQASVLLEKLLARQSRTRPALTNSKSAPTLTEQGAFASITN